MQGTKYFTALVLCIILSSHEGDERDAGLDPGFEEGAEGQNWGEIG